MFETADSTLLEAYSSLPNAFTTLIPPSCSSTSVVILASDSLTFKDTSRAFEEKFDVTAAAPMAVAAAPAGGGDGGGSDEEKDSFDVVLADAGGQKIQVIKEVRGLTSLGLKEAKELVDGAPSDILTGVSKEEADKAKEALEGAGATVELK